MRPSALTADLHSLSLSLPSQNKIPSFHMVSPSPLLKPLKLAVKAMGGEGASRENLDHLQRASSSKMRQQQQSSQPQKRRVVQTVPFGLWDRFPTARTVDQMMETMDRITEDPFAYNGASLPSRSVDDGVGNYRRGRTPWEIIEARDQYKLRFDMPGMTKKDVKIWVEEKMLVFNAEKQPREGEGEGEGEEEEWSSKSYGRYSSKIALPDNVEVEKIKAEVKDGVLYISIPKALKSSKILDIDVQ